jgi:hypothetical protein
VEKELNKTLNHAKVIHIIIRRIASNPLLLRITSSRALCIPSWNKISCHEYDQIQQAVASPFSILSTNIRHLSCWHHISTTKESSAETCRRWRHDEEVAFGALKRWMRMEAPTKCSLRQKSFRWVVRGRSVWERGG